MRSQRKKEHLTIARQLGNKYNSCGFDDIALVPNALPELNLEEVDTAISFLGKNLSMPLIINAITGGVDEALTINGSLARLAAQHGLGMAVGSQTIALDDKELSKGFKIVRKENRDGLILANVAANTKPRVALQAVDMIEADGLQIHLNIPQELAMKEGDRDFRGLLDNMAELARIAPVPIIAKEVGFGLSRETCQRLYGAGVRIFDVGGRGGTNFIAIEQARSGLFNDDFLS
ncbi:MAG: type 2 isopentenyl-diphosphate Delta-isomerase, partial [Syntrophomonadaceae bacterium]|nr:type 2 isopentenyl-diphosphate Delta-isomerase [Syntrophomonadaceae bacterium]